jgi:HAD superfamily hydrolase (TIGR01509 family)
MLRAVIFDFDGVIADSEIMHFKAFNESLQPYQIQISKQDYYGQYLGLTDRDLLQTLANEGILKAEPQELDGIAENKKSIFEELAKTAPIIDGVRDFLALLAENQIDIAICSGALLAEIELMLDKADLRHYFQAIVSAEHVAKGKPAPDGFLLALKKLNEGKNPFIKPGECVVIEDSRWGLEAARAAKMHTIAVTNSYSADELGLADKIVDVLTELTIENLKKLCE